MLKDQQESHQQQLASFLTTNTTYVKRMPLCRTWPPLRAWPTQPQHCHVALRDLNPRTTSLGPFTEIIPKSITLKQTDLPPLGEIWILHCTHWMTFHCPSHLEPRRPATLRLTKISDVRWSLGPFQSPYALPPNNDAADEERCSTV